MVDVSLDLAQTSSTYKDLLVINNDLVLTSDANTAGANPILQDLLQRIAMYLGEWFLDNTRGFPWYQQVLVKNPDLGKISALMINTIVTTPGVQQLLTFSLTPNFSTRVLQIAFTVQTTTGKVNWSGNLTTQGTVT